MRVVYESAIWRKNALFWLQRLADTLDLRYAFGCGILMLMETQYTINHLANRYPTSPYYLSMRIRN